MQCYAYVLLAYSIKQVYSKQKKSSIVLAILTHF